MKFTNGQWLLRNDVKMFNPIEIRNFEINNNSIIIYASLKHIEERMDTIDAGLMTVVFSSPMPDIICIRIYHFKGGLEKGPEFKLNKSEGNFIKIENNPDKLIFRSGNLKVHIYKEKYSIEFYNGDNILTKSTFKNTGYMVVDDNVYMREQLDLKVGENVYGLGERFTPFVKNGQVVEIWNEDGGTNSEQAYKNIPFYLTNKSYGVFVNHPGKISYEIASESVTKVQFSVPGEYIEYFIINGPTIKKILENYSLLTGRSALPPSWSFGLWLSTSFTTSYDEKTVTSFIEGMKDRDIPLSVFHFDCFWMKEFHFIDLEWDASEFPDPQGMIKRLKAKGLRICLWINPYVSQQSRLFDEGKNKGFLLKKVNGDVWQWDRWQAGMGIVDFTNLDACKWYTGYLEKLIDMGVDCFKTDFGERIPTDVVYFDNSDPYKMHNYYTFIYNKLVFELLEKKLGKGNAVVFSRSATAGCQKYPVHWGGDCHAKFESMAESLRGGLSLSLSGFVFWSHDIGGFESTSSADIYKRWIAFGLLSSHSRLHGNKSYRVPWNYDEESVSVLRFFTKLKCSLMPYLFSMACEASMKGIPVMRAMILEFPDDNACEYLDRQYMLGNSLLVAPVFSESGFVSYYLPSGIWTNFFTGEKVNGGCWINEKHDYLSIPLFIRDNSILAIGKIDNKPDYDYADDVTLHVFELKDNNKISFIIYNMEGIPDIEISMIKNKKMITVDIKDKNKPYTILLRDINELKSFKGCSYSKEPLGILIKPEKIASRILLELL